MLLNQTCLHVCHHERSEGSVLSAHDKKVATVDPVCIATCGTFDSASESRSLASLVMTTEKSFGMAQLRLRPFEGGTTCQRPSRIHAPIHYGGNGVHLG